MKRIFLVALAAIGMTACMQDEVVDIANGGAIAFDNAFIGNATRATAVTANNLQAFKVWGYLDNPGAVVFAGTEVEKKNGAWNYEGTQYWMPNNEYWFAAVAPVKENWILEMETATTTRTLTFANDCVTDLVYASKYVEADDNYDPVEFTFAHLLSKIQFTVTTNLPDYSEATVDNLQIVTVKDATIDLLESPMQWEPTTTETFQLNFNDDYFIVPAACEVSFDVTLKAVNSTNNGYKVTKTATLPADAFAMGQAYNLCADINPTTLALDEIEFNVTDVEKWDQEETYPTLGAYKNEDENKYYVSNAEGLAQVVEEINAGTFGGNVELTGDIDLASIMTRSGDFVSNWTPIGTSAKPFKGVFDGNGYTIKNLAINGGSESNIGFFGYTVDGEIKNLTIENAKVAGRLNVGVVAGTPYTSKYTNITVKGHVEVDGMAYVGAVGGKNAYADWTDITVEVDETSYVNANSVENGTAYRTYVGGVCGFNGEGGHTFKNITSNINVKGSTCDVGGLFGIAHYGNKFENCVCTGNVEIYAASEAPEAQEIGGIAGVWHPGGENVVMDNCSFTGTLKANNGYVIDTQKFGDFVCAAYITTGAGKLIIDGVAYGANELSKTPVYTADQLIEALGENKSVIFMNDIKIEPASMSNAYGTTGINVKNGQTIDGNGYTLNIQGAGGTWDSGINTTGGIIRNLTVTGSFRGIFINHTGDHSEKVVLENVTIGGNGTVYTISCDQGLYQGIEATNCTFNGWTSYAKTAGEAKFVNCSFGEGSGYAYCRPYSNTEFVNCTFCPGYAVDTTRATVTFTDCTFEE